MSRFDPDPCGTRAAYRRHLRDHEEPCYPCKQAMSRDVADRRGHTYRGPEVPDPRQVRNGLPAPNYRYQGTGVDAFGLPDSFEEVS